MGRCVSVINFKNEKAKDKEWKIKKRDDPSPGQYEGIDKGYKVIQERSPETSFKAGKRVGFAESA